REILLHQGGGNSKDVADIVEAVTRIVGGELFGGAIGHAQQVANGVGVLYPVQAMRGHAAWVDRGGSINPVEFTLQVLEETLDLLRGRFRNSFGGHLSRPDLRHDLLPGVPVRRYRGG